ncbi:MAG: hypothetical protein MJY87_11305 [Fibrobacter sp.]|nr:hypothetical protein [Fibrobacter sp.]
MADSSYENIPSGSILDNVNNILSQARPVDESNGGLLADDCFTKQTLPGVVDFSREWKLSAERANKSFAPIGNALGLPYEMFGREGQDDLIVDDRETILDICQQELKNDKGNYYGCTIQDKMRYPDDWSVVPYNKPATTTYIAKEWSVDDVGKAMDHEQEHQAIYTFRQAVHNDYLNRMARGEPVASDDFMEQMRILLKWYDSTLDILDKPHYIPGFGVYVNKASDIYPKLQRMWEKYLKNSRR